MATTPYFPGALPTFGELMSDLDYDGNALNRPLAAIAPVVLTAIYASSGAIDISVPSAFTNWPKFDGLKNTDTNEIMAYTKTDSNTLHVTALGRGRHPSSAAAGAIGNHIQHFKRPVLGKDLNQVFAELAAMNAQTAFRVVQLSNDAVDLDSSNFGKINSNVNFTADRQRKLPAISAGVEGWAIKFASYGLHKLTLIPSGSDGINVGIPATSLYCSDAGSMITLRVVDQRWIVEASGPGWNNT